jgi:hypothetical protein
MKTAPNTAKFNSALWLICDVAEASVRPRKNYGTKRGFYGVIVVRKSRFPAPVSVLNVHKGCSRCILKGIKPLRPKLAPQEKPVGAFFSMNARRFPPPWSVEEQEERLHGAVAKPHVQCIITKICATSSADSG